MKTMFKTVAAFGAIAASIALAAPANADTFNVTREDAGVLNSTATFSLKGVETFDSRSVGNGQSFSTNYSTPNITGNYTGVDIRGADVFGGAGNTNFASTTSSNGFSLDLSTTAPEGINYFGFWLSALDSGNQVSFYRSGTLLFSFSPTNVAAIVTSAYYGNPNPGPNFGGNSGQAYVFLNFFDNDGTFDKVVFSENPEIGGYESDNHTVGFFTKQSGTALPEPATWASMMLGFGMIGGAIRRRSRQAATA